MNILYGIVCRKFHIAEVELLAVGIKVNKVPYSMDVVKFIENATSRRTQFPTLFYNDVWYVGISQILNLVKSKKVDP